MLFTSYFANWPKLHKEYPQLMPISIALYTPKWCRNDVALFRELAPTSDILCEWEEKHDEKLYTERFNHEVLSHLRKDEVIFNLIRITNPNVNWSVLAPNHSFNKVIAITDLVLLCYEAPERFCHRHIVADWLTRGGYRCEELTSTYNPKFVRSDTMELEENKSHNLLNEELERRGIAVEELANILDVTIGTVKRWEQDKIGKNYIPYALKHIFLYWDVFAPYAKSGVTQKRAPGTWVDYVMRQSGLSVSELARRLDVSRTAVTKWRNSDAIPIAVEYAIRYVLEEKDA